MKALLLSAQEICELQDTKVRLEGEVKMFREALKEASDDIADWGAYADKYFQSKYDLSGNVEKYLKLAMTEEK